jgi:hypothetical protein
MEIPQGNSMYNYLYLKQTKMSCFSFYLFSSVKSENRKVEQSCLRERIGINREGRCGRERG